MPISEAVLPQLPTGDYAELRKRIDTAGLLTKKPSHFVFPFAVTMLLLILAIVLLFFAESLWLVLLDALFLAFVYGQIGLLGHDAAHNQVFTSSKINRGFAQFLTACIGFSCAWWVDKHNRHHAHTNHEGLDPDIDIPILAFSEDQAKKKRGFCRFIVQHQGLLFFPIFMLSSLNFRKETVKFILLRHGKRSEFLLDAGLTALHFAVYFGLLFWLLTPWHAILFIVVHHIAWGCYISSIFAPNHKGLPILSGKPIDYFHEQVLTARNIRPNPIIDFLYGGLNYQIEHHLFPTMPRCNYWRARSLIKQFCQEKKVRYHETSLIRSFQEIFWEVSRVSKFAR